MSDLHEVETTNTVVESESGATPTEYNPYYGVAGWLNFFCIMNIYVAPILIGIGSLLGVFGALFILNKNPTLGITALIELIITIVLTVNMYSASKSLRDIEPYAVQEIKKWILYIIAFKSVDIAVISIIGLASGIEVFKSILSILGSLIWYQYFRVSKRVQATYPDWNE